MRREREHASEGARTSITRVKKRERELGKQMAHFFFLLFHLLILLIFLLIAIIIYFVFYIFFVFFFSYVVLQSSELRLFFLFFIYKSALQTKSLSFCFIFSITSLLLLLLLLVHLHLILVWFRLHYWTCVVLKWRKYEREKTRGVYVYLVNISKNVVVET